MAKRKSKNPTIVSIDVVERATGRKRVAGRGFVEQVKPGQIFFLGAAGSLTTQALVVLTPITREWAGVDYFTATQHPHSAYTRKLYPGDLGMPGYQYDDPPCLVQSTPARAIEEAIKFNTWSETKTTSRHFNV